MGDMERNQTHGTHQDQLQISIDYWIKTLEQLSYEELLVKPSPLAWSYGQLYQHLVEDTGYFFDQVEVCLCTAENKEASASGFGLKVLENNAFPDMQIKGNPMNDTIPQPASKEALLEGLRNLKIRAHELVARVAVEGGVGKTKHPGLGYFSAAQWLQFVDIHFRHHLAQKNRIDDFLHAAE